MTDYRAILEAHGTRLVSSVAKSKDEAADALFGFVRDGRATWTLPEWKIVLRELDNSILTVHAWLIVCDEEWLQ